MIKVNIYLICMLVCSLMLNAHARDKNPNDYALMTALDMQRNELSNITITNSSGAPITTWGLFIPSFDTDQNAGDNCSACFGGIIGGDNLSGAMVSPVPFKTNQTLSIGQNFLYNMIYNQIYFAKTNGASPCSLPGCSWPGDDSNIKGWCISINVVSSHSSYTYSQYTNGSKPPANVPAYAASGNSVPFNYKYSLIDPSLLGTGNACLGVVICDDKTLTCKVATAQNATFKPYYL